MIVEELTRKNQAEVRLLILAGLGEHWGSIDPSLNPDLDDMMSTYRDGRTVVLREESGMLVGTGTLVPRANNTAEIVRMSVPSTARRRGIGLRIVNELLATATKWGATKVILETSSIWHGVIAFYLRCGFEVTHVEEGDFGSDTWFERHL